MSNLYEDYREIDNVRNKLDAIIDLVQSEPRRVFLTKQGKVQAIVIGPADYEDLWNIEFERDMKVGDEEEARGDVVPHAEVFRGIDEFIRKHREQQK